MGGRLGGPAAGPTAVPCVVEDGSELYSFFWETWNPTQRSTKLCIWFYYKNCHHVDSMLTGIVQGRRYVDLLDRQERGVVLDAFMLHTIEK